VWRFLRRSRASLRGSGLGNGPERPRPSNRCAHPIGASEDASQFIARSRFKMNGKVLEKSNTWLPRTSCRQEQHADGDQHRRPIQPANRCILDTGQTAFFYSPCLPLYFRTTGNYGNIKNPSTISSTGQELLNLHHDGGKPVKVVQQQTKFRFDNSEEETVRPVSPLAEIFPASGSSNSLAPPAAPSAVARYGIDRHGKPHSAGDADQQRPPFRPAANRPPHSTRPIG